MNNTANKNYSDNSIKSKAHYEMLDMFELSMKKLPWCPSCMDREPKDLWLKGSTYQDGHVNAMFLAYQMGVSYGVAITQE